MPSRTGGVNLPWPLSPALGCLQSPAAVSGLLPWPRAQQLPCLSDLSPGPGAVLPYLLWDAGGRVHCGRAPALRGDHAVTGELEWSGTGLRAPATLPASKLRGHWPGQDRAALCLLLLPVPSSSLLCPCIILTTWPLPLPPKTVTCALMGCHPRGIALGPEQRTFDVSTSKNPKYHDIVSHWMSTGTTSPSSPGPVGQVLGVSLRAGDVKPRCADSAPRCPTWPAGFHGEGDVGDLQQGLPCWQAGQAPGSLMPGPVEAAPTGPISWPQYWPSKTPEENRMV